MGAMMSNFLSCKSATCSPASRSSLSLQAHPPPSAVAGPLESAPPPLPILYPPAFLVKKLDAPLEATTSLLETPRKQKFISHELAVNMIIREKDPQRALETFNKVSAQKGFCHNNATYSATLHQLAQCKKLSAIDAVIRQMKYEPCKFHEAVFLNLMKHFA
ncbi:Pentatricopeptide repeat-containing protein [Drosera capensis]